MKVFLGKEAEKPGCLILMCEGRGSIMDVLFGCSVKAKHVGSAVGCP